MNSFRELRADEIDVRVSMVKDSGFSLLLYKDARVDQNLLDEVFTPFGWRRSHQLIGDRLYCTVEIWDAEKKEWVSKQDVGTESNTEKEKGQASDSFKRACFNWGIGRELYTAPFIWISDGSPKDRYKVGAIKYTNGVITGLTIIHSKSNKVVYAYGNVKDDIDPVYLMTSDNKVSKAQWNKLESEMERTGVTEDKLKEWFKVEKLEDMNEMQVVTALNKFKNTKDK